MLMMFGRGWASRRVQDAVDRFRHLDDPRAGVLRRRPGRDYGRLPPHRHRAGVPERGPGEHRDKPLDEKNKLRQIVPTVG
eukprot:6029942-Pyramimonas_sp.AAC.2